MMLQNIVAIHLYLLFRRNSHQSAPTCLLNRQSVNILNTIHIYFKTNLSVRIDTTLNAPQRILAMPCVLTYSKGQGNGSASARVGLTCLAARGGRGVMRRRRRRRHMALAAATPINILTWKAISVYDCL